MNDPFIDRLATKTIILVQEGNEWSVGWFKKYWAILWLRLKEALHCNGGMPPFAFLRTFPYSFVTCEN